MTTKKERMTIYMEASVKAALEKFAKREKRSVSVMTELIVTEALVKAGLLEEPNDE